MFGFTMGGDHRIKRERYRDREKWREKERRELGREYQDLLEKKVLAISNLYSKNV